MEFRAQYLQAMRGRAPAMFKELSRSGELDEFVEMKVEEAHQLYRQLLAQSKPEEKDGKPSLRQEREAEEQVKAQLFEFPANEERNRSVEKDELEYLMGGGPLLP